MKFDAIPWTLIEAHGEDGPILVRHRQFPKGFRRGGFPHRLNIFWQMSEAADNGMPEDAESDRMKTFEDRLVEATESDKQSVLSLVLTGNGQREYVIHTSDTDEFLQRLTDMPQEDAPYPIEIEHTEDDAWEYCDRVLADVGDEATRGFPRSPRRRSPPSQPPRKS